jgi:translation initiation factor 2 alpha subunit (eIF-2alpha)
MTRFFFDVVRLASSSYDFHGQHFKTEKEAREMAEIVSFDLACSENDASEEINIHVRDSYGQILFSVPVRAAVAA